MSVALGWSAGCGASRSGAPVCLAGAELTADGECRALPTPRYWIPFQAGFRSKITQGFHGYLTHQQRMAYSLDFECEIGDPVVAARGGRVWSVREDSEGGCDTPECSSMSNYVILDHGDGTFSEYQHLGHRGALVEQDEVVCRGQVIGLCGATGYTTGPHLHFAVLDTTGRSMPVGFADVQGGFGYLVSDTHYVSRNDRETNCSKSPSSSRLSRAAFAHQGVLLKDRLPIMIGKREQRMRLEGRYFGEHPQVALHRRRIDEDGKASWVDECFEVRKDGNFTIDVDWDRPAFSKGYHWFIITGGDKNCLSPGWAWAYKIRLDVDGKGSKSVARSGPGPSSVALQPRAMGAGPSPGAARAGGDRGAVVREKKTQH